MESKHVFLSAALQMMDVYLYRAVVPDPPLSNVYLYFCVCCVQSSHCSTSLFIITLHYVSTQQGWERTESSTTKLNVDICQVGADVCAIWNVSSSSYRWTCLNWKVVNNKIALKDSLQPWTAEYEYALLFMGNVNLPFLILSPDQTTGLTELDK